MFGEKLIRTRYRALSLEVIKVPLAAPQDSKVVSILCVNGLRRGVINSLTATRRQ